MSRVSYRAAGAATNRALGWHIPAPLAREAGLAHPMLTSGEQVFAELSLAEYVRGVLRVEHQFAGHLRKQEFTG